MTAYFKYTHPKECFIDNCKVHPEFLKLIKSINKKKRGNAFNDDLLDNDDASTDDDSLIKFVYPFGQSLDIEVSTCVVLNSGIIAYPANRALCCTALSKSKKGRLFVMGSEKFFEDEYFEKEENKKISVNIHLIKGRNNQMAFRNQQA